MLYEFRAVRVSYDERNFVRRWALRMNRARGTRLENRLVDLLHHRDGTRSFRPNQDAVGMKEVADRRPFTEKFWIGDDVELQAVDIVNRKMLPEALCRLHRHGAFFDHEAVAMRSRRDGARDGLNGAQIGFAIFQWGRADAYKNCISLLDSFGRRDESQTARLGVAFHEQIQMGLEKGQAASIEILEFAQIIIRTENLMANFRETSGGRQANITSTDD